jgi:7,8-dihydropterin-6-yl-methyl-4-(beta-D-ribofuranosyl)aminobenzene 5'-phosphate synthase
MKIQVLFNSESVQKGLLTGWGVSFLVDNHVLFDTGEDAHYLKNNVDILGINLKHLKAVVLSHDHWDHTGGVSYVIQQKDDVRIYICPGFQSDFKQTLSGYYADVIEAYNFTRVTSRVYSTGEIPGTYKGRNISEQALILKTEKGFSVITGCAHPGIIRILKRVKEQLGVQEFYAVFGGFHLRDHSRKEIEEIVKQFVALKVKKVGPTHCTGTEAQQLFQQEYKESCLTMKVGEIIEV